MSNYRLINPSRNMRNRPTDAEYRLWLALKNRRLGGYKFRRQYPFGSYILDFYCHPLRLAIELDGGQHAKPEHFQYDLARSRYLKAYGVTVVRFANQDVLKYSERVTLSIWGEIRRLEAGDG